MSDYLLDSGILIRHLRDYSGYPDLLDDLTDEGVIYISAMTRLEVVRGMKERELQKTWDLLELLETIPVTSEIADLAGNMCREWRTRGITLGSEDALIAASALSKELPLLTTNPKHFPMADLSIFVTDEDGRMTRSR
jgi:predicted nucleic acid-binding protein